MNDEVFPIAPGGAAARWICGVIALLTLGLGLFLGGLSLLGSRMVTLEVSQQGLQILGDFYGRLVPRASLKIADARPLNRAAEPGLKPTGRTNGIGLPNYQSGWFRLANGSRALLFVTDWSRAVVIPTTEDYSLIVSPAEPDAFLVALGQPADATFAMSPPSSTGESTVASLLLVLAAGVPIAISALLVTIAWSTRRVRFEVSSDGLRIRGDLFGRLVPRGSLLLSEARILDLKAEPEKRPFLRTCGVGLPGYLSGWFRLKDRSRGLVFLTDQTRALVVPTTAGYDLVISPRDPQALLRALRT